MNRTDAPNTPTCLPCPFCGGEPRIKEYPRDRHGLRGCIEVSCDNNHCPVQVVVEENDANEAAANWNRRCARSESAPIMPSNEAVILAAKIVVKKGEFADLFTASTAGILLATEILRLAYPNGVPEGLK